MHTAHTRLARPPLAALLIVASLCIGPASAETGTPPTRGALAIAIADQGNAALQRIRGELALSLKQSVTLPPLSRGTELARDDNAPPAVAPARRLSLSL